MLNSVLMQMVVTGGNAATQVVDTAKNVVTQVAQHFLFLGFSFKFLSHKIQLVKISLRLIMLNDFNHFATVVL